MELLLCRLHLTSNRQFMYFPSKSHTLHDISIHVEQLNLYQMSLEQYLQADATQVNILLDVGIATQARYCSRSRGSRFFCPTTCNEANLLVKKCCICIKHIVYITGILTEHSLSILNHDLSTSIMRLINVIQIDVKLLGKHRLSGYFYTTT